MDDYEDEGPLPATPQHQRWTTMNEATDEATTYEDDQMTQVDFDPFQSSDEPLRTSITVPGNIAAQKLAGSTTDVKQYPMDPPIYHPHPHPVPMVSHVIPSISLLGFPPPPPPPNFDPFRHIGVPLNNEGIINNGVEHMLYGINQPPVSADRVEFAIDAHASPNNGQYSVPLENVNHLSTMHAASRAALESRFNGAVVDSRLATTLPLTTMARGVRPSSPFVVEGGRMSAPPYNRPVAHSFPAFGVPSHEITGDARSGFD
jgi:hypothetical protein